MNRDVKAAHMAAARQQMAITPEMRVKITAVRDQARQAAQTKQRWARQSESKTDTFNRQFISLYIAVLNALHGVGDMLMTFTQTFAVSVGVPLTLLLLLVVEGQRVYHGFLMIDADWSVATFGSLALVIAGAVIKFTVFDIERRANYTTPSRTRFSLVSWWRSLGYVFNPRKWTPQALSPAYEHIFALRLVQAAILTLATLGSMRSILQATQGTWLEGIQSIAVSSSLGSATVWASVFLFSFTALVITQSLVAQVAFQAYEIRERFSGTVNGAEDELNAAMDLAEAQLITSWIAASKAEQVRLSEQTRQTDRPRLSEGVTDRQPTTDNRAASEQTRQTADTNSPKAKVVAEYLKAHPEDIPLKSRPLAEKITTATGVSVGKDVVIAVKAQLQKQSDTGKMKPIDPAVIEAEEVDAT